MRSEVRRLIPCTVAAALAFPVGAAAWPAQLHRRVAELAVRLMPAELAGQLTKHAEQLAGGAEGEPSDSCADHVLNADGSGGDLDTQAGEAAVRAIGLLRQHAPFAAVAYELGRLSHLVADATNPLNTSASDPREDQYAADFGRYAARKADHFPPVFNGYVLDDDFDVATYTRELTELANRSYPLIGQAYFPRGQDRRQPSSSFDDRDPVFAVAQLAYVRGVTATANVWLYVWREAHGDMSNTPHYSSSESASEASTRAAERQ